MPQGVLRELPRDARAYFIACIALAAGIVGLVLWRVGHDVIPPEQFAFALLVAGGAAAVQVRSPTLIWRGRRISVHPDEAILFLGFVALEPALVVLAALVAAVASQLVGRRPFLKASFNVAAHVLACGTGATLVIAARGFGVGSAEAALVAPLVVSAVSQVVVAVLLTLLAREKWYAAMRADLAVSIGIAAIVGTTLGVVTLSLYQWHPVSTIVLVPAGWLVFRMVGLEYRHRNELSARRALADATARLAATGSEDEAIEAARAAAFELFDLETLRIVLADGRKHEWSRASLLGGQTEVGVPLLAPGGETLGAIEVRIAWKGATRLAEDRQLLALVGTYLSLALASVRAVEARARAERLVSLQDLVKGIAHEINNPVMYASGALDIALFDVDDTEPLDRDGLRAQLSTVRKGLQRVLTISRALAEVVSAERPSAAPFDLASVAHQVATEANVHTTAPAEPLMVVGSKSELRSAIGKLVANAVEAATPAGARVVARRTGRFAEVVVSDNGPGIAAEERTHLFAPFFTTKPDGVGLGLSVALRIARDHGGDVTCEATAEPGARFTLRIPLAPDQGAPASPAGAPIEAAGIRIS